MLRPCGVSGHRHVFLERSHPSPFSDWHLQSCHSCSHCSGVAVPMSFPLQDFLPLVGWLRVLGNWWEYGLHLTSKVLHLEEKKKTKHQMSEGRDRQAPRGSIFPAWRHPTPQGHRANDRTGTLRTAFSAITQPLFFPM